MNRNSSSRLNFFIPGANRELTHVDKTALLPEKLLVTTSLDES